MGGKWESICLEVVGAVTFLVIIWTTALGTHSWLDRLDLAGL